MDDVQSVFAKHLGFGDRSIGWRSKLSVPGNGTEDRVDLARHLLAGVEKFHKVLDSREAMVLICEKDSRLRENGDKVAHSYGNTPEDLKLLDVGLDHILTDPTERNGMADIIDFLSSLRFPPSPVMNNPSPST